MKTFVSRTPSGVDSLAIEDRPAPGPLGPGQVRIAMRAAAVNYRDFLALSGAIGTRGPGGLIPCSDGAGEVLETAPDVWRIKAGDRVAYVAGPGTYAEKRLVPADRVVKLAMVASGNTTSSAPASFARATCSRTRSRLASGSVLATIWARAMRMPPFDGVGAPTSTTGTRLGGTAGIGYHVRRRIRLEAYGARLETGLGSRPHEFESRILRHHDSRSD